MTDPSNPLNIPDHSVNLHNLPKYIIGGILLLRLILLPFSYYARFNPVSDWLGNCCVGGAILLVIMGIIGAIIEDTKKAGL